MIERLDELLGRRVDLRALAVLRVLAGPVVVLHLWGFLADALDGLQYRDRFYEPYASWYPELPRAGYVAVLLTGTAAGVAMTVRRVARPATVVALGAVAYNLFLSTTHYRYNRGYLLVVLAALAVTPVSARGPAWPLWLLRVEAAVVYGTSGMTKLLDDDWFGGVVTRGRVEHVRDRLVSDTPLPGWAIDVLTDGGFHAVAAKVIVLTELFVAVGLLWRPLRSAAVWAAAWFHLFIEVTSDVQVFSYLAIAVLVIWATPATGERRLEVPARLVPVVRALDWLRRFEVRAGPAVVAVDRDGTVLAGGAAVALVLSRLPVTALAGLPLVAVLRSRRAGGRPPAPALSPSGWPRGT